MRRLWLGAVTALALLAAACGSERAPGATADPDPRDWTAVVNAARGQTVRWYLWGGSEGINRFVDDTYGPVLAERYDLELERVAVADTVDAVNQVIAEDDAGAAVGSVDLIWINGENFASLKAGGLLYDGWARALPNAALVDWDNPAVNHDFGEAIGDLESPWSSAQFQLVYDTSRTPAAELPRSYAELADWACAHPGRFTYVAPGAGGFIGTRFVKGALFEISGGPEPWQVFDESTWERWSPELWRYLDDLAPCLWRGGETYPADESELHSLFANDEVDFTFTQAAVGAGALISDGLVPGTAAAFVFDANSIGDLNYVAIPAAAPSKAAALVLANLLLDPAMQARQIVPENGFGLGFAIDPNRIADPEDRALLADAQAMLGDAAAPADDLARALVGDGAAAYQDLVEVGWRAEVLGGL